MSKLYRTVIVFEVLHDEPISADAELNDIYEETITGDFSGMVLSQKTEEVSPEKMRELLTAQGSDPDFLTPEDAD